MSVKVNCLNPIAKCGLDLLDDNYEMVDDAAQAEAILVRSASMHEMELSDDLVAVARAGAGVNNIPLDKCAEKGIVVFNTAEKAKKAFAGTEIAGKKLGIIGLGAIGVLVANAANRLGMEVYGCDPYLSVDNALNMSRDITIVKTYEEIYDVCDFITVHVPLLDSTKGMFDKAAFDKMKDGVVFLNFSRDTLVNEPDMKAALESGKVKKYVVDFPNPTTVNLPNTIVTPHLGASTQESEDNCAKMAVKEIRDFIENGNIKNSVNFPNCDMGTCKLSCM